MSNQNDVDLIERNKSLSAILKSTEERMAFENELLKKRVTDILNKYADMLNLKELVELQLEQVQDNYNDLEERYNQKTIKFEDTVMKLHKRLAELEKKN